MHQLYKTLLSKNISRGLEHKKIITVDPDMFKPIRYSWCYESGIHMWVDLMNGGVFCRHFSFQDNRDKV